jgi:predicted GIY-YIG superfamily endonuclease
VATHEGRQHLRNKGEPKMTAPLRIPAICGWIYILHLHQALGLNACHYTGSTLFLQRRMKKHARGHGSRFMKAVRDKKIPWELARAAQAPLATVRKLEQTLKSQKNTPLYCPICTSFPACLPGSYDIPPETIRHLNFQKDLAT